jgi:NNP family nitrate/nitrite transporter-like MFS transporter
MHTFAGVAVMFLGQDLPDGNYMLLHTSGQLEKKNAFQTQMLGCKNYRMWCMVATYGFCFGVELTMNNIVAGYLYDQFELDLVTAGTLASCYGLMNLFARSLGGLASDYASVKFGMRGRLWTLWLCQTLEGVLCIFMGLAKDSLATTILFMVMFSICVQASEGASYGVVPFLTRRALGVASGYIGAGGNAGRHHQHGALVQGPQHRNLRRHHVHGLPHHRCHAPRDPHPLPHVGLHVPPR